MTAVKVLEALFIPYLFRTMELFYDYYNLLKTNHYSTILALLTNLKQTLLFILFYPSNFRAKPAGQLVNNKKMLK